ncbi:MAG: hypothetical protein A3C93_00500 [Candidatus Lloydbacteria bacterium RIFCSPHIGHO2_02_FULL_54_17]|uniref:Transposase IS200-like domain-containing protein n=1 Tax=Candidatus Lloydbacteria bacterium RIFCSPHIGHO2_02_FULL_54_17 TaxID=1798664 RepID=A0A1G2DFG7_9BACT|nr:MAG: hypothetical protein A2762_05170 [Candidatus Lloydbacteria bacterium RIFCSPHIGHO2_01_FULL_54_11]OGZ12397.1 MAG: hypothetical protein A3C93_00500 [Candidatus Lloydbacteria bacterium RIFCSPHIGHO2_02_FULL_54_17]
MERKISFAPGEYYHLYNRGVEQRIIFTDKKDHARFIALLRCCNTDETLNLQQHFKTGGTYEKLFQFPDKDRLVAIGAYCLMPNHFHILVRELIDGGVSRFMLKLGTAYSMYFNRKYSRKGRLFSGPFQARHVAEDNYLKYLYAYIHLNPVKIVEPKWREKGIMRRNDVRKFLAQYDFSSYQDYLGEHRVVSAVLSPSEFPGYFSEKRAFREHISDWLFYDEGAVSTEKG